MKKIVLLILLAVVNVMAISAYQTSYDCNKVKKGSTEWTICNDGSLANWDNFLARTYNFAREKETNTKKLRQEQLVWLKKRNQCKNNKRCIEDSYTDRIQTLIDTYVEQQTVSDDYIYELVKKYPIKDCSKIKVYTRISKEMIAGDRSSAVHTNVFNKEGTDKKIQECRYIKEHIWNQEAFKNIEVIQPAIRAKFFKDERYQKFLKASIKKSPNLKVDLKYGSFRHHGGREEFWYESEQKKIKDALEQDKLFKARGFGSFNRINQNICDIRVYQGEFDGDSNNGDETLVFSGMVADPRRGFFLNDSYMKIYNFLDKEVKFTPFYEPEKNGKLKNTLLGTTYTCLNQETPFKAKTKNYIAHKTVFLSYVKELQNIIIFASEWRSGGITIRLYNLKKNVFFKLPIDKTGEAR